MATRKKMPASEQMIKDTPSPDMVNKPQPDTKMNEKDLPIVGNPENTVMIGGKPIEIKPTKLKYQRNRTATFYRLLELYPLMDIMAMESGSFGDERDGDKAVMDWLIAATDDEELILSNYDDMDTGTIEKILAIFKRVNRVEEKDAKLKNMEKDRKGAV